VPRRGGTAGSAIHRASAVVGVGVASICAPLELGDRLIDSAGVPTDDAVDEAGGRRRALHRQAILRAHFGVRRQPTVSTRSAPDSAMRTGQTGTPHTWWRSNLAKSCRNERPRRDRHRPGGTARLLIADSWRIHERRNNHRSHPARTGTLRANYRCHRRQAAAHGPHMRPPQRHRTGGRVYGRRCAPIF